MIGTNQSRARLAAYILRISQQNVLFPQLAGPEADGRWNTSSFHAQPAVSHLHRDNVMLPLHLGNVTKPGPLEHMLL